MEKWSLLLSPSPSAYPNQHFFCVVSRVAFAAARLCVFFLYIMVKSYYARIEALFGMIALNWDSWSVVPFSFFIMELAFQKVFKWVEWCYFRWIVEIDYKTLIISWRLSIHLPRCGRTVLLGVVFCTRKFLYHFVKSLKPAALFCFQIFMLITFFACSANFGFNGFGLIFCRMGGDSVIKENKKERLKTDAGGWLIRVVCGFKSGF